MFELLGMVAALGIAAAIVPVKRSAFVLYQFGCEPTMVGENQAYIETAGVPGQRSRCRRDRNG